VADAQVWFGRVLRSLAIAAIPVASLTLFATFAIFAGNASEFSGSFPDLIAIIIPFAAALAAVLAVPGIAITGRGRNRYETLLCAVAILLWVQGNILVWDYGVFDGSSINWLEGVWRGVLDILLWIAVLLLAIYGFRRFHKGFLFAALATIVIQAVSVAVTLNAQPDILHARDFAANIEGRGAAMRFSRTENIVHIVMDGFQSDIFASILADTSERDFKSELRGFTFFERHLGAYPYTQLTLPAMLSGKLFHNDMPVNDFVKQAIQGPTILNSAFDSDYEIDIMAPVPLKNVYALGKHSNAFGIATNGHVTAQEVAVIDAAKLIDLALFRTLPHFGKALVHRDELWVFQGKVQSRSYLHLQYFSDLAFLNDLATEMTADRDAPVYKMIHVMLSHRPFVGNERCAFDGRKPESRQAVRTHAQCGLVQVLEVLQSMKDLGIYDSSLIVLMADHGAWVPVENFESSTDLKAMTVAMATPTLAIEPRNAGHPFQVSKSPSSMTDIPATIADLSNIEGDFGGESAFRIEAGATRIRRHLTYGYGRNPEAEGYLFPMQEWLVNGNPYESESWQLGKRYYPDTDNQGL
jgi:hypothetical protein